MTGRNYNINSNVAKYKSMIKCINQNVHVGASSVQESERKKESDLALNLLIVPASKILF